MKIGSKYRLNCGHLGVVVGVYGGDVAVKGNIEKRCSQCSKLYDPFKPWNRMPTVFIISTSEGGE